MRRFVFVAAALALAIAGKLNAAPWSATDPAYPAADVRALGMANAYVTLTDGPTSLIWNPAGLAEQVFPSITGDFSVSGSRTNSIFFGNPMSANSAVGVGWIHDGNIQSPVGAPTGLDRFIGGLGVRLTDNLTFGMAGTFYNPRFKLAPDSTNEAVGLGTDIGALLALTNNIHLGAAVYDLSDAKMWRSGGDVGVLNRRGYRWGASYSATERLTLVYQDDQTHRVAAEWFPTEVMALRAGVGYRDHGWGYALGTGVRAGTVRFDYAYSHLQGQSDQHRMGLSFVFPRGQAAVQMTKPQVRSLYASLGKAYSHQPVASIVLVNSSSTPITTRVELLLPRFMTAPSSEEVTLRPYSRQRVFLKAVLAGDQIETVADQPIQGVINLVNPSTGEIWRRQTVQTFLYRRGALTWDDVKKASAFVTPADPDVRAFVRESLRSYRARLRQMTMTQETISTAAILFEAAAAVGISYQSDPNTPFAEARRTNSPLDMARRIGANTLTLAFAPVQIATNPIRTVITGPDSARGDTLGLVGGTVTGVSNMVAGIGSLGEESLRFLLYPYQAMAGASEQNIVVDDVLYPAELLRDRAGDCDDTAVLMCAMLECAGVTTAFVESPEHIYMMFDTRIPSSESPFLLPAPVSQFVDFEGTWWVPLETTMIQRGFAAAWFHAAAVTRTLTRGGTVPATRVADGWALYEPMEFRAQNLPQIAFPDPRRLEVGVMHADSAMAASWDNSALAQDLIAPLMDVKSDDVEQSDDISKRRADAVFWLLLAGRFEDANRHLTILERSGYESPRILGLRAVYWFYTGDFARSEASASSAHDSAPNIPDLVDLLAQIRAIRGVASQ